MTRTMPIVKAMLSRRTRPIPFAELLTATGVKPNSLSMTLWRLAQRGEVVRLDVRGQPVTRRHGVTKLVSLP